YVIYVFARRKDFLIHLKIRKVQKEFSLLLESLRRGFPTFNVQILGTLVSFFLNNSLLKYGSDLDVASLTIMTGIYNFYHMAIIGITQGNNTICGYNIGAKLYDRVKKSL